MEETVWSDAVERFIKEKQLKNRLGETSAQTYRDILATRKAKPRSYRNYAKRLYNWLIEQNIETPTLENVDAYFQYLHRRKVRISTINQRLRITRQFFTFLDTSGIFPNNVKTITDFKERKSDREAYSRAAVTPEIFRALIALTRNDLPGSRDRAMFYLAFCNGLRSSEIITLKRGDVLTRSGGTFLKLEMEKGNIPGTVKLTSAAETALHQYLEILKAYNFRQSKRDYLFPSFSANSKDGRLRKETVSSIAKKYFRALSASGEIDAETAESLSFHSLRHGYITQLEESGMDVRKVSKLARHSAITTTQRYSHIRLNQADHEQANRIFGRITQGRPGVKKTVSL